MKLLWLRYPILLFSEYVKRVVPKVISDIAESRADTCDWKSHRAENIPIRPHSFALHHSLISVHPPTGCDPTWLMEGTLRLTQTMNQVGSYSRHPCCSSSGVVFFL